MFPIFLIYTSGVTVIRDLRPLFDTDCSVYGMTVVTACSILLTSRGCPWQHGVRWWYTDCFLDRCQFTSLGTLSR